MNKVSSIEDFKLERERVRREIDLKNGDVCVDPSFVVFLVNTLDQMEHAKCARCGVPPSNGIKLKCEMCSGVEDQ